MTHDRPLTRNQKQLSRNRYRFGMESAIFSDKKVILL